MTCLGHDVSAPDVFSRIPLPTGRPRSAFLSLSQVLLQTRDRTCSAASPQRLCAREITLPPSSRADASCSAHAQRGRPSRKSLRPIGTTTRYELSRAHPVATIPISRRKPRELQCANNCWRPVQKMAAAVKRKQNTHLSSYRNLTWVS